MVVGLYVRVSTLEQANEGYSIAAQKESLVAYCKAQGWSEYKFYVDEGVSAKDTKRPKLQLLLEDIKQQKINIILVYRLDRFTRSVRDLHQMLDLLEEYNCKFRSATEVYDTTTAMGRMFIGLVALLAQWETENLSERIIMALDEKAADGEWSGQPPYGYDVDENDKLVKNDKGKYVLDIINKLEAGWSYNSISEHYRIIDQSRGWSANAISRIVRNPALYGASRRKGEVREGTHEGYITKERFLRLQKMLDDRGIQFRKDIESTGIFGGVLVCPNDDCGHRLIATRFITKRADGSEYVGYTYRCSYCSKHKRTQKTSGERYFIEGLTEYMQNINFADLEAPEPVHHIETEEILQQIAQLEQQRLKYQRGWAADHINDVEFEELMHDTKNALDNLQKQLDEYEEPEKINLDAIKNIIVTFNNCFVQLNQEEKNEFVQRFIRKIEFSYEERPPKCNKYKKGRPRIIITNLEFY